MKLANDTRLCPRGGLAMSDVANFLAMLTTARAHRETVHEGKSEAEVLAQTATDLDYTCQ
jgi:hypothetical protein